MQPFFRYLFLFAVVCSLATAPLPYQPIDRTDDALAAGGLPAVTGGVPYIYKYAAQFGGPGNGQLYHPAGIAMDSTGNVYVADTGDHRVQKFSPDGSYLSQFGSLGSNPGQFRGPSGITLDGNQNIFVSDGGQISKFDSAGHFLSRFGPDIPNYNFVLGISGIAMSPSGNLYVADSGNNRIVVLDPRGNLITYWGGGGSGGGKFTNLTGIVVDQSGDVYAADSETGLIQVFDGTGRFLRQWSVTTPDNTPPTPVGLALDDTGKLFVTTSYNHVCVFDLQGQSLAAWGTGGTGPGEFIFNYGSAVTVDRKGNVYVSDSGNNRIQKFDANGVYLSQWGQWGSGSGEFNAPQGVDVDATGIIYVVDSGNSRVQKFDATRNYLAQWGSLGFGPGQFGRPDGIAADRLGHVYVVDTSYAVGGANEVDKFDASGKYLGRLNTGQSLSGDYNDVATDGANQVYVTDGYYNEVFVFDSGGNVIQTWTRAGPGNGGFFGPAGIAVDQSGNVYVSDSFNYRVLKFDSSGNFLAKWGSKGTGPGQFTPTPYGDLGPGPIGIAVDSNSHVFVVDLNGNRVEVFDTTGRYLTEFGTYGSRDGEFNKPWGVATDAAGSVYVADQDNNRIQVFAPVPLDHQVFLPTVFQAAR